MAPIDTTSGELLTLPDALPELIDARLARTPAGVMLVDETGRTLTFAEVDAAAQRLGAEFTALGVRAGSRVCWQLPTWPETVVLMLALSRLGAVQVPVPHIYRAHEVRAALAQTSTEVVVTPSTWRGFDFAAMVAGIAEEQPLHRLVLDRGALDRPRMLTEAGRASGPAGDPAPLAGDDVRWVFFTSGTSSAPKGAQHTDLSAGLPALAMARGLQLGPDDRSAVAFPAAHIGGLNWVTASLLSGCRLLLAEAFGPDVVRYLDEQGVTLPGVVTAHHLAYRDAARAAGPGRLFRHARAYPGGGATKPPTLQDELREVIGGVGIVSGYGMTEHPMITMASVTDPPAKLARTEGRPSPGVTVSIREVATGAPCPAEVDGEIWVRGPHQFRGYLDAEATAAVHDADGFLRTGDLGHLDADGYVVITGRVKDVIVRKGENISAKEVEDHLYTHPDVADVAVVGIPDEAVGERCVAVLVLQPGATAPSVAALGEFLAGRGLMTQKWPEQAEVVEALPRNTAGKVLKTALVRDLTATP